MSEQRSYAETVRLPDDDWDAFTCHLCGKDYQFCECCECGGQGWVPAEGQSGEGGTEPCPSCATLPESDGTK